MRIVVKEHTFTSIDKLTFMKKMLFSILLSLAWIPVYSQWTAIPQLVVGSDTATQVSKIKSYHNKVYMCTNRGLFVTSNDGNTWTNLTYTNANTFGKAIRSVHVDSVGSMLYAATDSAVFVSSNNGTTWSPTSLTGVGKINDIDGAGFTAGATILVSYGVFPNGGVYVSTNGFATATPATAPNHAYFDFLPYGSLVYLAGNEGVYKSTDNGMTWAVSGTGFPTGASNFFSLAASGPPNALFAGNIGGNGLFKSADNGATWTEVDTNVFNGFCQVFDVVSANGTMLTTMDGACNTANPIKASTDNGSTWSVYMAGLTPGFYPVLGRNTSGTCFFTFKNNDRTPYRICYTGVGVNDYTIDIIGSVHPNPASGTVTFTMQHSNSFELRIINISGQLVHQQVTGNTNKVTVDVSDFPGGVYFAQVRTKEGTQTIKFIKD